MCTLEKNNTYSVCILCMLLPQITPLLTLVFVRTWVEESTPRVGESHPRVGSSVREENFISLQMWRTKHCFWPVPMKMIIEQLAYGQTFETRNCSICLHLCSLARWASTLQLFSKWDVYCNYCVWPCFPTKEGSYLISDEQWAVSGEQ